MQPLAIPAPPAVQPAAPAATKKPVIFWILLMALGCLFLTAVVLVLFLSLKH
jgi:flagellar basal body-associated protein FliL